VCKVVNNCNNVSNRPRPLFLAMSFSDLKSVGPTSLNDLVEGMGG